MKMLVYSRLLFPASKKSSYDDREHFFEKTGYTLLLYMPDYKDESAGIEKLMPWSDFIKERCTGITDIENVRPENRGNLNI